MQSLLRRICMLRSLKKLCWMAVLVAATHSTMGFTLWGVREPYQVTDLGYIGDFSFQPHNLGEEYRWNIPTLYYAMDQSFLDYFGSNGVVAVDAAIKLLNDAFSTNSSSWSHDLSEFPQEGTQLNYTASALHLFDLKSCVLELLVERLGLIDPEAFTWTLRNRVGTCPGFTYTVIKRNFDPVTWEPSTYVNGNLYTYTIVETCPVAGAFTLPAIVDRDALLSTAIATPKISVANPSYYGFYHTALTRDDIGGFRYLYRTNNINLENAGPGTTTRLTNNFSQLQWTSNLTVFAQQAFNTNAAGLQALYPDLVITGTSNYFTVVWTTNITPYFTNYPFDPVGTPPHIAFTSNRVAGVETHFRHSFANLSTVVFSNGAWTSKPIYDLSGSSNRAFATLLTTYTTNSPFGSATTSTVLTNSSSKSFLTNMVTGEFYILPTNACDLVFLSPILTVTNTFTNVLFSATNTTTLVDTNVASTNVAFFNQELVTYSTNHAFVVYPVICGGTNLAWRQGIDKIQFIRRDYDSLLGRYWYPITNRFKVIAVTNNSYFEQSIERVVTAPDIVFSAGDLVTPPTSAPLIIPAVSREVPNVDTNGITPGVIGVYGPGTIQPTMNFTFNKVGPIYYNYGPFLMDEATSTLDFIWASFDGTTNYPVIYPSGTSIVNMEAQIVMQFTAEDLVTHTPLGAVGTLYGTVQSPFSVQFASIGGGQAPYTWSLAPQSGNLPSGFAQPSGSDRVLTDGIISGEPEAPGTYEIIVRFTEAGGQRFVDRPYNIIVNR